MTSMSCPVDNPSSPAPEIPRFAVTIRNSFHAGHDSCLVRRPFSPSRCGSPFGRQQLRRSPSTSLDVHHACLSVPESFWDLHRSKLMRKDLTLKGPTRVEHLVKATKAFSVNTENHSVCLETGWAAFVAANRLRDGDTLEFSLIADSFFIVDLLILID